jgi:hypothetical protein
MNEMVFDDLAPAEVPVRIGGERFVLREASGDAAAKYNNARMRAHKLQDGALVGLDGVGDLEPLLVSLCLYKADKDGGLPLTKAGDADPRFLVPQEQIRRWKGNVQHALFDKAKELSPWLIQAPTPEALREQIALLQKQLEVLEKAKAAEPETGGDPVKN